MACMVATVLRVLGESSFATGRPGAGQDGSLVLGVLHPVICLSEVSPWDGAATLGWLIGTRTGGHDSQTWKTPGAVHSSAWAWRLQFIFFSGVSWAYSCAFHLVSWPAIASYHSKMHPQCSPNPHGAQPYGNSRNCRNSAIWKFQKLRTGTVVGWQ